jgi:hypothetical protein
MRAEGAGFTTNLIGVCLDLDLSTGTIVRTRNHVGSSSNSGGVSTIPRESGQALDEEADSL